MYATFPWFNRTFYILRTYVRRIENFLRASEVKVFAKNSREMIEYSEAWQSFRDLNFKNPLESHFSCNKKCFVSHKVIIQSALYSSDPVECFTNSERMRTTHRKFSTSFSNQCLSQKLTQNDRTFWSLAELQKPQLRKSTRKWLFLQ